jgi:hypothetical protein
MVTRSYLNFLRMATLAPRWTGVSGRPRTLLRLICPMFSLALLFFGSTRLLLLRLTPSLATPHASSCMPSCMQERGNTARIFQCEREHSARAHMRETQRHERESAITARVPRCEREGGSTARVHMCVSRLHALPWGATPGGAGVPGAARACP